MKSVPIQKTERPTSLLDLALKYRKEQRLRCFLDALTDIRNIPEATTTDIETRQQECIEKLDELNSQIQTINDYNTIRDEYIKNEVRLCQLGLLAPAFRPNPINLPRIKKKFDDVETLALQDRIKIDVIWLRMRNEPVVVARTEPRWRSLFKHENDIPIHLLHEFSASIISGEIRANEILNLTPLQQVQTRTLKGNSIRNHINLVEKSNRSSTGTRMPSLMELAGRGINRWAERDRRIQPEREKYLAIIQANALLTTSAPTWPEVAKLTGLILGKPALHPKTVADLFAKAKPHIPNS